MPDREMRGRRRSSSVKLKTTATLRRSPRFLHQKPTCVEYFMNREPTLRKNQIDWFFSLPNSSTTGTKENGNQLSENSNKSPKGSGSCSRLTCAANLSGMAEKRVTRSVTREARSLNDCLNPCGEISGNDVHKATKSKCLDKTIKRCIKSSSRLEGVANVGENEENFDSEKQHVIGRRVTRSLFRRNKSLNNGIDLDKDGINRVTVSSIQEKAKVGIDFSQKSTGNTEKKFTHETQSVERATDVSTHRVYEVAILDRRKPKGDSGEKREVGERKCEIKKQLGVKRKRDQVERDWEFIRGWSEEQELALTRAYLAAKPTPHFWKKVAKMVPGKSAEECFNRIHYDHLTPPQSRTRSRTKKKEHSPIPYSASKLLSPAEIIIKKPKSHRKTLMAQKTVRHLLEKQCNEERNYEADLFSVLEPDMELSSLDFHQGTPLASPVPNGTICHDMSSSPHKKQLSRSSCLHKADFASPPVLKQIKNKALHDKYIDQLHNRDARRKLESLRNGKNCKLTSQLQVNSVKVAKDALVFDAQDAVNKLRDLRSSTERDIDEEDDEITDCNDENEEEDELC